MTSFQNITQLSFRLISEPMFGDYSIIVQRKSRNTLIHQFTVNRYGNQLLMVVLYKWRVQGLNKTTLMFELHKTRRDLISCSATFLSWPFLLYHLSFLAPHFLLVLVSPFLLLTPCLYSYFDPNFSSPGNISFYQIQTIF